ncbi:aminodeoxychorismate synthase, component I [bacterium]|nr:MAG: aminodeoxychorismate synthase, component I [bacterium]
MELVFAGTPSRAFYNPLHIVTAERIDDVVPALERVEQALDAGRYVAGFLSYELGTAFLPRLAELPRSELPLLMLGIYDHPVDPPTADGGPYRLTPLISGISRSRYDADIAALLAAIFEGELYQANYSVPFHFGFSGDPWALFQALRRGNTAPHAAYVRWGTRALLSCSPELFLTLEPLRITAKPMKGTAPLDAIEALDSAKNRAEHVMIVDLLRNDLHRICSSVRVERLFEIERYPTFATMTSMIVGDLHPGVDLRELLTATFPCGSITGAPKIAAMQHIARLERRARGPFTGSIGYLAPDRSGIWNVAIRTAHLDLARGRGLLEIGGGIVADSTSQGEWDEVLVKRRFFDQVTPRLDLIETLRREADGTYHALQAHLERMERSANVLAYPFDRELVERRLRAATPLPERCAVLTRLALDAQGGLTVTMRPLNTRPQPVAIALAPEVFASSDPLLIHKTSWRPRHDAASRWAAEGGLFDAILRNERGEIADGARTTFFAHIDGRLLTPPVESGALPGILRARLLADGKAEEHTLMPSDLAAADALYVGNSARGLLRAALQLGAADPRPRHRRQADLSPGK